MVFGPSEHEVAQSSNYVNSQIDSESSDDSESSGFKMNDAFSRNSNKNDGTIGLPPLSSGAGDSMEPDFNDVPPLALDNHQARVIRQTNPTTLRFDNEDPVFKDSIATTTHALGSGISTQIADVARAIKEAQLKTPTLEIEEKPKPLSNKLTWNENKSPIESLFSLRKSDESVPVPTQLFSTSLEPVKEADPSLKASIGLENTDDLPRYTDHQYGRLASLDTVSIMRNRFGEVSGTPDGYLISHKRDQNKRFDSSDTKYSRVTTDSGLKEIRTAKDFTSLEITYGENGSIATNEYDAFRRPLSKLQEQYGADGSLNFELTEYTYGKGKKVKPFPDYTRVIASNNSKAQISMFSHKGLDSKLACQRDWA